ncbi:MAG: GGDEF domain-containing protein [Rubrivivax sp.]|nr:GGDEF domain-containing protein [Rubrivivax sp.]
MDELRPASLGTDADALALRAQLLAVQSSLVEGRWTETESVGQALYDSARAAGNIEISAEAALAVAKALFNVDRLDSAEDWCKRTREAAVQGGLTALHATGWVVSAAVRARLDRTTDAIAAVAEALDRLDSSMPAAARRTVYFGVAITYRGLGLWTHAADAWRAAVEVDRASDGGDGTMISRLNLIECGLRAHDDLCEIDAPAAEVLLHEMLAMEPEVCRFAATLPAGWYRFRSHHMLGALLVRRSCFVPALSMLQLAVSQETGHPNAAQGAAWLDLGRAQAGLGNHTAARASAAQARTRLDGDERGPGGLRPLPGLHDLWRVERMRGNHDAAVALLAQHHQRVVRNVQALLDAQVAGLTRQLSAKTLSLQNADLRERNAGLARSFQDISRVADTDPLTGVLNRRAIEAAFATLQLQGRRFVVAMIDLDHFKAINDTYSHGVGDAVLRRVTATLQDGLRAPDRLGRYGGEEFTLLLAEADLAGGAVIVERLRLRVAAVDWSVLARGLVVTFSAGLVGVGSGEGFDEAVARADRLLYQAKHLGRNRVVDGLPTAV